MNRGYFNLLLPQLNRQLLGSITAPSSKYTDGFRHFQFSFLPYHDPTKATERLYWPPMMSKGNEQRQVFKVDLTVGLGEPMNFQGVARLALLSDC
ncbi:hypothetical protein FEAC_19910 [Ferrimicrobium acidiphilum DSM 19497]|uniref:Uncharacterized protein n=1 Tax=Ferrimicrobium acidiphilum DSM 19497 TaxID=1121877 RepID=A0A0D8FT22_9ACTN|nr:hypothetical protein FEAC_19910 [Ferrimicrobium acidiphilum DSM 19497]